MSGPISLIEPTSGGGGGSLEGDASGPFDATVVGALRGSTISSAVAPVDGDVLTVVGGEYTPQPPVGGILAAVQYAPADFANYEPSSTDGEPHPLDETNLSVTFTPPPGITTVKITAKIFGACNMNDRYDFGLCMWDFDAAALVGFIDLVLGIQSASVIDVVEGYNFQLDQLYTVVPGTEYHWGLGTAMDAAPASDVNLFAWGITTLGPPNTGASPATITVWTVPS